MLSAAGNRRRYGYFGNRAGGDTIGAGQSIGEVVSASTLGNMREPGRLSIRKQDMFDDPYGTKDEMTVTKFPIEKVYPEIVGGREIWAQDEPPEAMVWAVCPHLRSHHDDSRCRRCPRWETHPDYGKMQRGCYGMAAETCRIVFAMQKRLVVTSPK